MTTPVVLRMPEKKLWEKGDFTMSFLLPSEHQSNPPKPTNVDVSRQLQQQRRGFSLIS